MLNAPFVEGRHGTTTSGVSDSFTSHTPAPARPAAAIIGEVARARGITVAQILSVSRNREVCAGRREIAGRLRAELDFSYPRIAKTVAFRSHASAVEAVQKFLLENPVVTI